MSPEISFDDAWRVINRDYWDDVRGLREEVLSAIRAGEITNAEELDTYLNTACEYHERVIYTNKARIGLCCTDHQSDDEDDFGELPKSVEVQMFFALQADVMLAYDTFRDALAEKGEPNE